MLAYLLNAFLRRKIGVVAFLILVMLVMMSIFAPFLSPYDPDEMNPANRLLSPRTSNLFGTDQFGRDLLSRVIFGSRVSLMTGGLVVLLSLLTGVTVGLISGFFSNLGRILMRFVDCLMAYPALLLALGLVSIIGNGLMSVVIAVSLPYATRMTRLAYSITLKIREEMYIEAARAIGADNFRILIRHVLINTASPLIVQSTFTFAFSILSVAALNFLGLGIPPYIPSWGATISLSRLYVTRAPWMLIFPGLFIMMTVSAFNVVGDTLRDALDPQLRNIM